MARPRHAMRVHPLRTQAVVVGIPVAAAVAFGAHSVLGVTPLSDQQDTANSTSAAPQAAAPVQSYGLAQAPPPTSLGLLASPVDPVDPGTTTAATGTGSSSGTATGSGATQTTTHRITGPTKTVPIAAPKPSMMTFSGAQEPAAAPAAQQAAAPAAARQTPAPAPAPTHDTAPQQEAPQHEAAPQQSSGGGALLGVDLGVAKVSVLSFG